MWYSLWENIYAGNCQGVSIWNCYERTELDIHKRLFSVREITLECNGTETCTYIYSGDLKFFSLHILVTGYLTSDAHHLLWCGGPSILFLLMSSIIHPWLLAWLSHHYVHYSSRYMYGRHADDTLGSYSAPSSHLYIKYTGFIINRVYCVRAGASAVQCASSCTHRLLCQGHGAPLGKRPCTKRSFKVEVEGRTQAKTRKDLQMVGGWRMTSEGWMSGAILVVCTVKEWLRLLACPAPCKKIRKWMNREKKEYLQRHSSILALWGFYIISLSWALLLFFLLQ